MKMRALIQGWRKAWRQGDFPVYYVQIAPNKSEYAGDDLPRFWEAQTAAMGIKNTGMAVIDLGDLNQIHPTDKEDVGHGHVLWALAKTYGRDVAYSGPMRPNRWRWRAGKSGCILISPWGWPAGTGS